jgi:hypothetical protein
MVINDRSSPTKLYRKQWFTNALLSRLEDKRTGAIVVVMQRVHVDDLTGFLLAQADEWHVLSLPAVAYCDTDIPMWDGNTYCRKSGEVLSRNASRLIFWRLLSFRSAATVSSYDIRPPASGNSLGLDTEGNLLSRANSAIRGSLLAQNGKKAPEVPSGPNG